jgi:hypothetical protein
MLNDIFGSFDELASKFGLEKIKTMGDCYMAASGVPNPNPAHAEAAAGLSVYRALLLFLLALFSFHFSSYSRQIWRWECWSQLSQTKVRIMKS